MVRGRNDISLMTLLDGEQVSHFRLREFENRDGLAMVHPSVLLSLERVRRDMSGAFGEETWLIITDAVRTDGDLKRLAARFGWIDEGGKVSRDSKHLTRYGGIAVDLVAVLAESRERVSQPSLGRACRKYFDWVKDDYADGHVHADNRGVLGKS
ncbi:MAG: hypothetical protein COA73_17000 [Candidatus Hydrogenedentota bacterium]|nr:MAG: hypothetical protein COA73_17000 [Candidatus Hydrogenedentota bacterium]